MKLTFVTQNEAPFRMKWMDELAKYMDVHVFHLNEYEKNVNSKYISYKTQRAITKDASKNIFGKKFFDIPKILNETHDVLLLDGYGFFAQQLLIIYLILTRKKFGITVDGGFIPKKENIIKKIYKKFIISHAIFYLSTSFDTDNFLMHYGVKKDLIFRHNFSNVEKKDILQRPLLSDEKKKLRNKLCIDDKFTIISVGQIINRKGFDILLEALDYIKEEIQVLIIGSGNDEKTLSMIEKDSRVIHLNFITKKILDEYYMASDIFILPTREDIWGLVIGEAMAKGLPVITSNKCLAGKALIDKKVGSTFTSGDFNELKEAIDKLYIADLYSMGIEAIEVIKKYTIEESAVKDYELFKELKKNEIL